MVTLQGLRSPAGRLEVQLLSSTLFAPRPFPYEGWTWLGWMGLQMVRRCPEVSPHLSEEPRINSYSLSAQGSPSELWSSCSE